MTLTTQKPEMNADFLKSLSSINRTLYKAGYNFHLQVSKDATHDDAHAAGMAEVERVSKISKQCSKPQVLVDISTGRKFKGVI